MDLRTAGTQGLDGANRNLKPLVHLIQSVTKSAMPSPLDDFREVLRDEAIVVRLELDWVDGIVALAVEIVRVECLHCRQRALVRGVSQVRVRALSVPTAPGASEMCLPCVARDYVRVEAVVADHVEGILRQAALLFKHVV